jgi:hypothetical protein
VPVGSASWLITCKRSRKGANAELARPAEALRGIQTARLRAIGEPGWSFDSRRGVMVTLTFASWNQIALLLRQLRALRSAA